MVSASLGASGNAPFYGYTSYVRLANTTFPNGRTIDSFAKATGTEGVLSHILDRGGP